MFITRPQNDFPFLFSLFQSLPLYEGKCINCIMQQNRDFSESCYNDVHDKGDQFNDFILRKSSDHSRKCFKRDISLLKISVHNCIPLFNSHTGPTKANIFFSLICFLNKTNITSFNQFSSEGGGGGGRCSCYNVQRE